jgi:hypothetical protein
VPILTNPKHELFAQALAKGENSSKAYVSAGFKDSRANASRLKANSNIARRVRELSEAGAKSAEITIASLLDELEHARQRADSLGQLSASVKAITSKAAISGLLTQKIEISEPPQDFTTCTSLEEIGTALLSRLTDNIAGVAITHEDRVACFELLKSLSALVDDIAARAAKPANIDVARLEQKSVAAERKRFSNVRF